jgi:hypothetical protein
MYGGCKCNGYTNAFPKITKQDIKECVVRASKDCAELDARLRQTFTAPDNELVLLANRVTSLEQRLDALVDIVMQHDKVIK